MPIRRTAGPAGLRLALAAVLAAPGCASFHGGVVEPEAPLPAAAPPVPAPPAAALTGPVPAAATAETAELLPPAAPPHAPLVDGLAAPEVVREFPSPPVWGVVGLRGYAMAERVAPNGLEYRPIFSIDSTLNLWLWRSAGLYASSDTSFWAQRAAPGITNTGQGAFDFSKREFDFDAGLAWNAVGRWEARVYAYSYNNLNRGASLASPAGFNDGVGLEGRYYLSSAYDLLGTAAFDVARATFVSLGYFPTKDIVDGRGLTFHPGPYARAYLLLDLWPERCYLFADLMLVGKRSFSPKLLDVDAGVAVRPFPSVPRWEFRLGTLDVIDFQAGEIERSLYGAVRLIY